MSDEANTATETVETKEWEAVLHGGTTYTFGGKKYEKGVAVPVDNATKEALEKRAVDNKIVDGEYDDEGTAITEPRQKFKFHRVGEKPAPVRARPRATR